MFRDLKIILTPESGTSCTLALKEKGDSKKAPPVFTPGAAIYAQEAYTIGFKGKHVENILSVHLYVNDELKSGSYRDGEYRLARTIDDLPIFHDCVGTCRIRLSLRTKQRRSYRLETDLIPIITSGDSYSHSGHELQEMLFYIAEQNARHPISPSDAQGIVRRVELAEQITESFQRYLDLFQVMAGAEERAMARGFLSRLISDLSDLEEIMRSYVRNEKTDAQAYGGRYWTPAFFTQALKRLYQVSLKRIEAIFRKLNLLMPVYERLSETELDLMPTALFVNSPGFKQVYYLCSRWTQFIPYEREHESFLLTQISLSEIYENFSLCALIEFLDDARFDLIQKDVYSYGTLGPPSRSRNYVHFNVFNYRKGKIRLTLYVEPVIYQESWDRIGLELIRNNSVPFSGNTARENQVYYCPDYVIKIEREGDAGARYFILDAKFSTLETIQMHYLPALTFKYLFSISPKHPTDSLYGLGILYGKCTHESRAVSMYDLAPERQIRPVSLYLPLNVASRQASLRYLFGKIIPDEEWHSEI